MKHKYSVVLLILFLAIGYASVTTKFIIDGDINLTFDDNNFVIEFVNSLTTNGTSSISADKRTVNFKTNELKAINDEAILSFNIANKSRNYNASVRIKCDLKNSSVALNEYFDMTLNIKNPLNIETGNEEHAILTIQMKKEYSGNSGITPEVSCTFTETPFSRDEEGNEYVPTYKEVTLNGAEPVLDAKELVPVTIADNGTVTKADTKKDWYDYSKKKWANAVILVDNPSKTYNINDPILDSDIESYFVWIPRFRYQIFDAGNYTSVINANPPSTSKAQEIKIEFEDKETPISNGSTKGSWLTHPAFTKFDVNGFWIGKFETGYKGATSTTTSQQNIIDTSKVIIKPNTYSWRGINVANAFYNAYNYQRNLESHLIKNVEWGAVAYLSHSKYGINTEIRINNHSGYLTGYAAAEGTNQSVSPGTYGTSSSLTQPYNTVDGYKASTTGNITGVYDMSGCAWEIVAGFKAGDLSSSGFTAAEITPYADYFDVYPNNSTYSSYNYRILGDATGELGPFYSKTLLNSWYSDQGGFVETKSSWFGRGGNHTLGLYASQFFFGRTTGQSYNDGSYRIVLFVKNQ